ncbi:unnamed protein product [Lampetra fluviatilis]
MHRGGGEQETAMALNKRESRSAPRRAARSVSRAPSCGAQRGGDAAGSAGEEGRGGQEQSDGVEGAVQETPHSARGDS